MTRPGLELERLAQEPARPDLAEAQAAVQAAAESRPSFSEISQRRVRRKLQDSLQRSQRWRRRWRLAFLCGAGMVASGVVGATMGPRLASWLSGTGPERAPREDQGTGKAPRHSPAPPDRPAVGAMPTTSPALDQIAPSVDLQTRPTFRQAIPAREGLPATEPAAGGRLHKPAPSLGNSQLPPPSPFGAPPRSQTPATKPASGTSPGSRVQPFPVINEPVDEPVRARPGSPAATPPSARQMAINTPASEPRSIPAAEPLSQPSRRPDPLKAPLAMPSRALLPSLDPNREDALLLGEAIRLLRAEGNPRAALANLDRAGPTLSKGAFAPELTVLRIEALLALGRKDSALSALDRLSMSKVPRTNEWLVVRAELRGEAGRWRAAEQDFDHALASGVEALGQDLGQRAIWGRSVALARQGDSKGARHAAEEYLRLFPHGRFLRDAQKIATASP